MFDELQDQIDRDEESLTTPAERRLRNIVVLLVSIVLFGGLYAALRFLES